MQLFSQEIDLSGSWWVAEKQAESDLEIAFGYLLCRDSSNHVSSENTMYCEELIWFKENDKFLLTLNCTPMIPKQIEPVVQAKNGGIWKMVGTNKVELITTDGNYVQSHYFYSILPADNNKVLLQLIK